MLSTRRALFAVTLILAGCGSMSTALSADPGIGGYQGMGLASASGQTASGLQADLTNALLKYHRLDGLSDGSTLTGVQYPPVPGVSAGDQASLKNFITNLSSFLASKPGIAWNPVPAGTSRTMFRRRVARQAAADIQANAKNEYETLANDLSDPNVKGFVLAAVNNAQPQFFRAPSSASGNFHPADEFNPDGLLVHSVRDMVMAGWLADYFHLPSPERDVLQGAMLIHDIQKGGIPWRSYDPNHGPDGANWLQQFEPGNGPEAVEMDLLVRDHMGQWNQPTPTPPQTLDEQIVCYADYLASLDDVYVDWQVPQP